MSRSIGLAGKCRGKWPREGARAKVGLCAETRQRNAGTGSGLQAAFEIAHANRIDFAVVALNAADGVVGELDSGYLLCPKCCRRFDRGIETPLRFGQGFSPARFGWSGGDDARFRKPPLDRYCWAGASYSGSIRCMMR